MNEMQTTADALEAAAIPRYHEAHTDPDAQSADQTEVAATVAKAKTPKSQAEWTYERIILYIQNFEKQLDGDHEVAMGFTGGDVGVMRIEGMGFFDPDLITFYGTDAAGVKTQQIQHVSQLNIMLRALPKAQPAKAANRIGFRLAANLGDATA